MCENKRQYNYRENLIREASRKRKNRKQLLFAESEYKIIENKFLESGAESFSDYIRDCIYNKKITNKDLDLYSMTMEKKNKRKQICFNDEEIKLINKRMKRLKCDNFILFITTLAIK